MEQGLCPQVHPQEKQLVTGPIVHVINARGEASVETGREVSAFSGRGGESECYAEKLPSPAV